MRSCKSVRTKFEVQVVVDALGDSINGVFIKGLVFDVVKVKRLVFKGFTT